MSFKRGRSIAVALLACILAFGIACTKAPDDSQLTQQIQAKLSQDSGLQGKSIDVQTSGGVATLSGTVDNDTQRAAAAHYASTVPGIKEIVNNLQVAAPAQPAPVTNLTAETVPPKATKPAAKPRPSVPSTRAKKQTPKQDSPDWDAPPADSSNADQEANAPSQVADATPAPQPAAVTPPPPPPKKQTIASGTTMAIRLVDPIDSETAQPGQTFKATLDSPLSAEGEIAIPSGYNVEGHVVDVKSAGKFAGQSLVVLQLDRISVGGKSYNIQTDQYKRQGSNRSTNTAEKVGAGAVIGAIIGGIAGGGKGAGIGAAAGGGVGGGVQAATKGQQIKLPSETVLNFTLQSPLTVTQVEKGPDASRPKLDTPH